MYLELISSETSALFNTQEYVITFGVSNPVIDPQEGSTEESNDNSNSGNRGNIKVETIPDVYVWGLKLTPKSENGANMVDANMIVPGVPLVDYPLSFMGFFWSGVGGDALVKTVVLIEFYLKRDLGPGEIDYFSVQPPKGIKFVELGDVYTVGMLVGETNPCRIVELEKQIEDANHRCSGT